MAALYRRWGLSMANRSVRSLCEAVKPASSTHERENLVVRVADGSPYMTMLLRFNGRVRMLNRLRTAAFEKTLERIGLVSSRTNTSDDVVEVSLFCGTGDNAGQAKSPGTLNVNAFCEGDILRVDGREFKITVNPPCVLGVVLPQYVSLGMAVVPHVHTEFVEDKSTLRYEWKRVVDESDEPSQDVALSTASSYEPCQEDVGCSLSVRVWIASSTGEPTSEPVKALLSSKVDGNMLEPGYKALATHTPYPYAPDSNKIRVCTYNILAEMYTADAASFYPYCHDRAMSIGYRDTVVRAELPSYHADIICLQEVEERRYGKVLQPAMTHAGFASSLRMKKNSPEGCATFWRSDRFSLVNSQSYVLSEEVATHPGLAEFYASLSPRLKSVLKPRNSVVLFTHLRSNADGREIIVGNTHLYYHPSACDQRIVLVMSLMHLMNSFREAAVAAAPSGVHPSLLLCGDFNSVPTRAVHEMISTGSLRDDHPNRTSQDGDDVIKFPCQHPLRFGSVAPRDSIPWSNYTAAFVGLLDYIYFEEGAFKLDRCVPMPSEAVVKEFTALPSLRFCSDHLPVIGDLELT